MKKRCVIIGAGEFTETALPIENDDFVIAADGGYLNCIKVNIKCDLLVGDFDSLHREVNGIEILRSIPEKDDTDMLLAVKEGIKRGYERFVIYGGMGGRLEHTFANIQTLHYLAALKKEAVMISQNASVQVLCEDSMTYDASKKGYISIYALSDEAIVSLYGLKYELNHYKMLPTFPIGAENEFIGKESRVCIHKGSGCIIINER